MNVVNPMLSTGSLGRARCACICTSDGNYSSGYTQNGYNYGRCGGWCYTGNSANNSANYAEARKKL